MAGKCGGSCALTSDGCGRGMTSLKVLNVQLASLSNWPCYPTLSEINTWVWLS